MDAEIGINDIDTDSDTDIDVDVEWGLNIQ